MTRTLPGKSSKRMRGIALIRAIVGLGVVALAAGGGWVAIVGGKNGDNGKRSALTDMVDVRVMDFDVTTVSTGEIEAKNRIEIRSKLETEAAIVEIVREGARVAKGDLLVQLNGNQLQEAIDREKIDVEGARAEFVAAENDYTNQVEENESSIRKAELKVTLARLALNQWLDGELMKRYEELKLAIERARRDLERQRDKYERSQELFAQGFLSKNELDLDEIGFIEADSKYETAILDEEIYWTYQYPKDSEQKHSDVTEAEAELERVKRSNEIALVGKQANLDSRRQRLAMREERLAKLEQQLESCRIVAPTSGLVIYATSMDDYWDMQGRGAMQIGRMVSPNDLIMVLPDVSELIAKVRVHETIAGRVREGLPATIKIDALGGAVFTGEVQSVGVLAESTNWRDPTRREFTVRIAILDGPGIETLRPSGRCEAEIRLSRAESVKTVPVQAVFSDGPVRYVYMPRGPRFIRKPVQVGQVSDMYSEIVTGLESGDRVLLRRPTAGEIVDEPWNEEQLQLVGLRLNDRGEPERIASAGGPGEARRAARGPSGQNPAQPAAAPSVDSASNDAAESSDSAVETAASHTNDGESVATPNGDSQAQPASVNP